MHFEIRLEGGKWFHIGYVEGDAGKATILIAPTLRGARSVASCFSDTARATWSVTPMRGGDWRRAAGHLPLIRPLEARATTRGAALIYIQRNGDARETRIDVALAADDAAPRSRSTFDDWLAIIRDVKDDLNREALLRLYLDGQDIQSADFAALEEGKALATENVELHMRPRAIQWRDGD